MPRGFAVMDKEKQRRIASKGGKAAHVVGKAHEFTQAEAIAAGTKGGNAIAQRGYAYMAELGRKGGRNAHAKRLAAKAINTEAAA